MQKLSYQQMAMIKDNLLGYKTRMDEILNTEISSKMNQVGNDNLWSGASAAEARAALDKLKQKFPEFVKSVDDCVRYLDTVMTEYKNLEQKISGQAN